MLNDLQWIELENWAKIEKCIWIIDETYFLLQIGRLSNDQTGLQSIFSKLLQSYLVLPYHFKFSWLFCFLKNSTRRDNYLNELEGPSVFKRKTNAQIFSKIFHDLLMIIYYDILWRKSWNFVCAHFPLLYHIYHIKFVKSLG